MVEQVIHPVRLVLHLRVTMKILARTVHATTGVRVEATLMALQPVEVVMMATLGKTVNPVTMAAPLRSPMRAIPDQPEQQS